MTRSGLCCSPFWKSITASHILAGARNVARRVTEGRRPKGDRGTKCRVFYTVSRSCEPSVSWFAVNKMCNETVTRSKYPIFPEVFDGFWCSNDKHISSGPCEKNHIYLLMYNTLIFTAFAKLPPYPWSNFLKIFKGRSGANIFRPGCNLQQLCHFNSLSNSHGINSNTFVFNSLRCF